MRAAKINAGVITNIALFSEGALLPDNWRAVSDDVLIGWIDTGNDTFASPDPPIEPTLDQAKTAKQREINAAADNVLASIISQYPHAEINSWQTQLDEATAYTADSSAPTPFIDGLVARRPGVDKPTLAARILANATAWKTLSADVFGQRQALEDIVDAATTVAEVEAVTVVIEMP